MVRLCEKKDILMKRISVLLEKLDKNELTYCSNNMRILLHEVKGLCGLFGYVDLFNLIYEMENASKVDDFVKFTRHVDELRNYKFNDDMHENTTIINRKLFKYILIFRFSSISQFNLIVSAICECGFITYSRIKNDEIVLYVSTYCDMTSFKLLCKTYNISIKLNQKSKYIGESFLDSLIKNNMYFNEKYLQLFLLESVINIARIANKKFVLRCKFDAFELTNRFLNDYYILFAELIKNIFSHSERKNSEIIKVRGDLKNNVLSIQMYNRGKKVRLNQRKHIFEKFYTTSSSNALSGQGIGLFDVKTLLQNRNGIICFKNKMRGVSFIIKIPVDEYIVIN